MDSEVILGYLKKAGFTICDEIEGADIAIVNTCSFIRGAEEESIDIILKLCQLKEEGKVNKIVVCGCLPQKHKQELVNELKEVDAFIGAGDIDKIVPVVNKLLDGGKGLTLFGRPDFLYTHHSPRILLSPRHFAYVKISEGCNHRCSFCIIPNLRGRYRSRPIGSILKEADQLLHKHKVSEINLIGQDTTMYGQDLYKRRRIAELLKKVSRQAKDKWVRLLYAHPVNFPQQLIKLIKEEPSICKYIDLPIQHINDRILKKMSRGITRKQVLCLIDSLRKEVPDLCIRTTLIVGFPGETDRQFSQLLDFIRQMKFERLGLFKYSPEKDTRACKLTPQIPQKIKQSRYDTALKLQQDVARENNAQFLGKRLSVLIDEEGPQDRNQYLGRSQYDAPEVDGCVYVKSKKRLKTGDFVQVKIVDTLEYDLVAEAL